MGSEREHKWLVEVFPDVTRLTEAFAGEDVTMRYAAERTQHDTYFDTPQRQLQGMGAALRIRRFGTETLVTYKGPGAVVGSLHIREEVEVPFVKPWPQAVTAKLAQLGVAGGQLEPVLDLRTTRTRYLLYSPDSDPLAELSFDKVRADHSGRTAQFRELELEAQPDTPDTTLARLGAVVTAFDLTPHERDKLTHALSLLGL